MDMDLENIFLNEYVSLHSFLIYESWMKIEQFLNVLFMYVDIIQFLYWCPTFNERLTLPCIGGTLSPWGFGLFIPPSEMPQHPCTFGAL